VLGFLSETTLAEGQLKTVLIVDDDEDIRESLAELLRLHGLEVATAADGREALRWLRSGSPLPCLVLLDIMMPGMNGLELHEAMSADPALSRVTIVFITGAGAGPAVEYARKEMKREVLKKPMDPDDLVSLVRRYCS
jgi:CheY-like chemotaxis protein